MIRVFHQYVSPKTIFLMLWEGVLVALCLTGAAKLRFWRDPLEFDLYTMWPDFGIQLIVSVIVFQVCFYYNELYDPMALRERSEQMLRVWQALGAACVLLGFLYLLVPGIRNGRGVFLISVVLLATTMFFSRAALDFAWRATGPKERVLVLGSGQLATAVARELSRRDDLNLELAGFVDNTERVSTSVFGYPVLGPVDALQHIVAEQKIGRIIIALEDHRGNLPIRSLVNLRVRGVPVEDAHTALAALTGRVRLETVRPSWFVYSDGFRRSKLTAVLKRALDLSVGVIGLVVCSPVMALVAAAVRLDSPGPVFYRQTRVGRGGRLFEVLKFRSMRVDAENGSGAQWAQVNDPRVTRVGNVLRKYRLDELPQFINVIRAEMSFVGPRPERPVFVEQLREKIPYYDERHSVHPGITGWAQVQYGYGGTVEDSVRKLEYDLFYLKNMSILFDCAILVQTVRIVLFARGSR